jgi:hypothetical protein
VGVTLSREADLLSQRRFLQLERGVLELERMCTSSALSASTWATKIFDILPRSVILGEWRYARECRLWCNLDGAVRAVGCGVQVALGLAGEDGPYMGG